MITKFLHLKTPFVFVAVFLLFCIGGDHAAGAYFETWTPRNSGTNHSLGSATYGKNIFVVGGIGGLGTILTSPDGINWTPGAPGTTSRLDGLANDNTTFVAVGAGGTIRTSSDGSTWTGRNSGTSKDLYGITYGNNSFVVVGQDGTILTSPDGIYWTPQESGTDYQLQDVAYGNNIFVVVIGQEKSKQNYVVRVTP